MLVRPSRALRAIMLALLLPTVNGCSVGGLFIGAAIDKGHTERFHPVSPDKVPSGAHVVLVTRDSARIEGRLIRYDADRSRMFIEPAEMDRASSLGAATIGVPIDSVARVAKRPGPYAAILGLGIGVAMDLWTVHGIREIWRH